MCLFCPLSVFTLKQLHAHVRERNLEESIEFYTTLFHLKPFVLKTDYSAWMLDDLRIKHTISTGHSVNGIEHWGLQVESEAELHEVYANMEQAK